MVQAAEFTLANFKALDTQFEMARSRSSLGVRRWDLDSEQEKVSSFCGPNARVVLLRDSDFWLVYVALTKRCTLIYGLKNDRTTPNKCFFLWSALVLATV